MKALILTLFLAGCSIVTTQHNKACLHDCSVSSQDTISTTKEQSK